MTKKLEKELKQGMDIQKEVLATAEAIAILQGRHGGDNTLAHELSEDLTIMHEKRVDIETLIATLQDPVIRQVFTHRYIEGLTWQDVADTCYISLAHAHRLHKKGLEALCTKS